MWYQAAVPFGMLYLFYRIKVAATYAGERMQWRGITDPRRRPKDNGGMPIASYMKYRYFVNQLWQRDMHMACDPFTFKWLSHEWRPITEWKYPYNKEGQY